MMAAELVATGAWEIFWFQGLSAGNRLEPSREPRAFGIDVVRNRSRKRPTQSPIETLLGRYDIEQERASPVPACQVPVRTDRTGWRSDQTQHIGLEHLVLCRGELGGWPTAWLGRFNAIRRGWGFNGCLPP